MVDILKPSENTTIVVADDSKSSRERIENILKESGYNIVLFASAQEAIVYCEKEGADLVIMDDIMPECNGFKALSILKNNVNTRNIPVIFISSLREIEEKAKAIELGADDCVTRPVNRLELKVRVKNLISLKSLRTEMMHRERLVSIGRLAGGIAHEINNPLTGVMTNLQMMEREIKKFNNSFAEKSQGTGIDDKSSGNSREKSKDKKNPSEKLERYIKLALKGGERCSKIVGDLLEYSAPPKENKIVPVNINELIEKSVNLLRASIKDEHITLNIQIPGGIPNVKGTKWELQQIVISLLTNAFQAVRESESKIVEVKVSTDRTMVVLEIKDTGRGIPEKNLGDIFDLFYTTRSEGEGMGLGLSAVNQIVMKYGGKISVSSAAENGSTFKVHLQAFC